ncbi:MAG: hypothetical protein ACFFAS_18685 [Promethearchaeota archaeon]
MERRVKGTILKDIVIGIKSDKGHEKEYDEILSDEAKEFLHQRVLNSVWYSWDILRELYKALIKIVAKNDRNIVIKWGNNFGENVMSSIYKNVIAEGKVDKLVEKYRRFHGLIYNFGTMSVEKLSDNEILFTYRDIDDKFEMWYYGALGWTQRVLEMCLKKKVSFTFLKKSWQGDKETQFKLFWSP